MRGFLFNAALFVLIPLSAAAADKEAAVRTADGSAKAALDLPAGMTDRLDSVVVSTSRAGKSTPVTYTMVSREQLRKTSPVNSLPMALSLQPSVVSVNEGGTGLGYSKMTVRGSKGSQINVTLNGITLNDAESQEVFWVNIPALSNILSSVQVQRGLGTSANGAGAFGASINMSTASVGADPYGSVDLSYGSFNTFTATAAAGTGQTKAGVYFDFAYSRGLTDGYIRNAYADVQSAFAALGWMNEKNSLRLTWLFGDQHTGITWNGIDLDTYKTDRRYNEAGQYYDAYGNVRYYDNDTDNYTQHHLQLNYTRQFRDDVVWSTTFNWTKGDGYYENYKAGKKFTKYGFPSDFSYVRDDVTYLASHKSDFIVREAMDNNYFVINSDVRYLSDLLSVTGGVNLSRYDGDHIGKLLWNEVLGDDYGYDSHYWYLNNGLKQEANVFARAEYTPMSWMTAYVDLQYRGVSLKMSGEEDDGTPMDYSKTWSFFNPRAGLTFKWNTAHRAYVSAAMGNREPGRSDIKEIIYSRVAGDAKAELKPEKMVDVEIGYAYSSAKVTASANLYFMEYWDMLLETGKLSDVGYAIKENVGRSYRRGIELAAGWQATPWLRADANLTLSLNRILDYKEYVSHIDDYWEATGQTTVFDYGTTTMLMSPSVTGMARLAFSPWRGTATNSLKTLTLAIDGKYVGKQYIDNTMTDSRSIPGYFVSNLSLSHEFRLTKKAADSDGIFPDKASVLGLSFHIGNLFNNMYYADGWCWKNIMDSDGTLVDGVGIYPQAPINFMFKVSYRL